MTFDFLMTRYGIGNIRDERLNRAFQAQKVKFHTPPDYDTWFNIMVIHQNRYVSNISSSGDFSNNSYDDLIKKIDFLKLDNIKLVKGEFKKTMIENPKNNPQRFCAALIDCDLYDGYKVSLPFIYNRLNRGGYIYLDEYYSLKFPGAKIACDEFFKNKSEKPEMHTRYDGEFERWGVVKK